MKIADNGTSTWTMTAVFYKIGAEFLQRFELKKFNKKVDTLWCPALLDKDLSERFKKPTLRGIPQTGMGEVPWTWGVYCETFHASEIWDGAVQKIIRINGWIVRRFHICGNAVYR